jgi:anti-sigma factor RsiW
MNCRECREQLVLAEAGGPVSVPAREHLEQCAACREFVRDGERLRAQMRILAESEHAPQELHERVQAMIDGRVAIQHGHRRFWAGVAAAIILLTMAGYGLRWYHAERSLTPSRLAREFIVDHLNYLPGREEIVSDSARDVQQWFQGRVDFPVRVPQLPAAALEDARVCNIAGRRAVLLHYRRKPDETLVSLFVTAEPESFERSRKSMEASVSYQGLNSTLWCHRGLVYSLVASLDDASLKQIAESVRQQEL